jgi:hypothetical protein
LKKVVIYRNGVGYFERGGRVDSDRVEFKVRKDEVGDFLATLAVLERGGSSVRSASFPLDVAGDPAPKPAAAPDAKEQEKRDLRHVVMALDGKEHDLQVGYIAQTPVWRPSYRLVIDKDGASLQTWGIVQNLSGEDWNDVALSLVAEAPLAFDASLGTPVIPGRPTVSDGGDVIAVVPRSETSLEQAPAPPPPAPAMAAPYGAGRLADVPSYRGVGSSAPARAKKAARPDMSDDEIAGIALSEQGVAAEPAYSRQTRNLAALAAISVQSGTTRYDLPATVTIPDKSSTMVMLADQRIPGEVVALYAPDDGVPDSSRHPFRVARFVNRTGGLVERGPLAIFAGGAFSGQGVTDPLPDGATATVPFGLDRRVAVEVSRESRNEGARLRHIEAGTLTIARDLVSVTKYKLRNGAGEPAKLLIKHARIAGARIKGFPAGTEDNVGTGSALVPVQVAGRATSDLVLDERQENTQTVDWLSPLADEAVRGYLADGHADAGVAAQLKAAWDVRRALVDAQSQRQKLATTDAELRRSTDETRANLKALEKNTAAADLRAKLTTRLADDSARLDVVDKKMIEVDLQINEGQVRFNDAIRAVKMLTPIASAE